MPDPFRGEKISNWVSDFCESAEAARLPPAAREAAAPVLEAFMSAACARADREPVELEEADVRHALLAGLTGLALPPDARRRVPDIVGAFLAALEGQGRLGGGRALGAFARALRKASEESSGPVVSPIRRGASRLGPNDPCPCGSGRKYKKCCKRLGRT